MDTQIIAAVIGGFATIAAVVIGWWLHEKKSRVKLSGGTKSLAAGKGGLPSETTDTGKVKAGENEHHSIASPAINLSKITVKEIVDTINSVPPFQKDQTAKQYNGIKVKWTGYLKEATEDFRDKESVRVSLTISQDALIGNSFWFAEKIANIPEIRTLQRGSGVSVVGEIISASGGGLCVGLKPIAIEVLEDS